MKDNNKNTSRYNLFLTLIVAFSIIILVVFVFFSLTFLIKNINLLLKPLPPATNVYHLDIDKAKEIFKDIQK